MQDGFDGAQAASGDSDFGSPTACNLQVASTLALLTAEALCAASDSESDSEAESSEMDEGRSSEEDAPPCTAPADGCVPDSVATHANGLPLAAHNWRVSPPPDDLGLQHPLTRVLSDLAPGATHWHGRGLSHKHFPVSPAVTAGILVACLNHILSCISFIHHPVFSSGPGC